jgi:hypothetical protein
MADLSMPDLAMRDLSMPDLSMPDLSKPDMTQVDLSVPCAKPWLLMSAEDYSTSGSPVGTIFRFSIGAGGQLTECLPRWTGGGGLDRYIMTLAPLSGTLLATATRNSGGLAQILDTSNDTVVQAAALTNQYPMDVTSIVNPSGGETLAAVGDHLPGDPFISDIDVISPSSGAVTHWTVASFGISGVSSVNGISQSPLNPNHFFLGEDGFGGVGTPAAWDENPWPPSGPSSIVYATTSPTNGFDSFYAMKVGTTHRSVYIQTYGTDPSYAYQVDYIDETNSTLPIPAEYGPLTCPAVGVTLTKCGFIHAVPDPTANAHVFVLCDTYGPDYRAKYILYLASGPTCSVSWDGTTVLPMSSGLSPNRLAIWQ